MKKALTSILIFIKHPLEDFNEKYKFRTKLKWLFFLLLLDILLMFVLRFFQHLPVKYGFIDVNQNQIVKFVANGNIFYLILIMIIVGPVMEESIFRLPLKIKKYNFIPFIIIGILFYGIAYTIHFFGKSSWFLIIPVFLTGITLVIILYPGNFKKFSVFLKLKYGWYLYILTFVFALLHLFNYRLNAKVFLFAPLLILPQFCGGILLAFIRNKFGFIWGIFLHSLNNALFLLPVYFMMNLANPEEVINVTKDGYTIEILDGFSGQFSGSKITPNEIVIKGTLKQVISTLTMTKKERIKFINPYKCEKQISVHFVNDSAYSSSNTSTARQLAMHHITSKYDLKIKPASRWTTEYILSVVNQQQFQNYLANVDTIESPNHIRSFFGKKDTIKLINTNSEYLKKVLELNFGIFVENEIDKNINFSVEVPNGKVRKTGKFLETRYGIELQRNRTKRHFMIVR